MNIIWTATAHESYLAIIDQIFEKWNIETVELFEQQVEQLIDKIENHNHICPKATYQNLHKCVINKHNSLIYKVKNTNTIEIIVLLFNKSEHAF
jgi:plasmid stabilization system protein ParE